MSSGSRSGVSPDCWPGTDEQRTDIHSRDTTPTARKGEPSNSIPTKPMRACRHPRMTEHAEDTGPKKNLPWLAPEFHSWRNDYKTQKKLPNSPMTWNHSPMIWNQYMMHWHKLIHLSLWLPPQWQDRNFHGPMVQTLKRQQKEVRNKSSLFVNCHRNV